MKLSARRQRYVVTSDPMGVAGLIMLTLGLVGVTIKLLVDAHLATSEQDRVVNSVAAGICMFVVVLCAYGAWRILHPTESRRP